LEQPRQGCRRNEARGLIGGGQNTAFLIGRSV
jgi:hypothetical protein